MPASQYGSDINLEELRGQLAERLAVALVVSSVLLIWVNWPQEAFPFLGVVPLAALLGLGWTVRKLAEVHPALACHLLVWNITAGLAAAMWVFPAPWIPLLGLPLVFVGAMLVSGGGFATAGAIAALTIWLVHSGARTYPLLEVLIALALGVALAWQAVRTLYTALDWTWTMQQRADHLLELARDRQGELNTALKSLDTANKLLRRTQRELIVARKQAEEARLMKEQFAANVSHELRTPLNLILGFSEIMHLSSEVYGKMDWPLDLRRDVYQIHRSARHLLELIDDVLDLSRLEMVGFTLDKEPVPLELLLREAVEIGENLFRGQPVRLEAEISPGLPTLDIDRTRVRQVLLNLLNNAARFTEQGTVRVEAKRGDGEVVISVTDTGPGIPADRQRHLFEEFYQVDRSLHRKHGGTGLGLAISKHFVEAHDGRIWVESQEGVGSTFSFALPIPGESVPFSRLSLSRPLEIPKSETAASILVLDPDPSVATWVDRHIKEYEVVQVGEMDRLPEQVMLHHPQAVVWNTVPAEPGGYDSSIHDGAISVPVPIIKCPLPSKAWLANRLAVVNCLTKPVTSEQLLREIDRLENVHDVLIVDDDRNFCQLVERMLETTDRAFDMRSAYGGADGLHALRTRRPDLLLLDLIMPDIDGFQMLEEMRQEPELADIPVVLLTATSFAEDAMTRSSDEIVIRRPGGLSPAEVLRCLRAVIGVLEPRYDEQSAPAEVLAVRDT